MHIGNPLYVCFALLAAVTFAECSLLHAKEGFLMGEDTPVWIAERPEPNEPVMYTRLEKGIVKEAVDAWRANPEGLRMRSPRSIDDDDLPMAPFDYENTFEKNNVIMGRRDTPPESSTTSDVLYPSVLVVMDYDQFKTTSADIHNDRRQLVKDRIVYALAFWNGVDIDFRNIQKPRLPLRVTGIVITQNRRASPYLDTTARWYALHNSVDPMMKYWKNLAKENEDFALGSYDIIAHMTDMDTQLTNRYPMYPAASTGGPPCNMEHKVGGILFYDDLAFRGLNTAVHALSDALGDESVPMQIFTFKRKGWTTGNKFLNGETRIAANYLENALKTASCMAAPKESHQPGKPIKPILPGELMPAKNQCIALGWAEDSTVCSTPGKCDYLYCKEIFCRYAGEPLDGTACSAGKICLRGECVPST